MPGLYLRFPHLLTFRRYSCPDCTCGLRPSPLSAGVFARVVPAVSALLTFRTYSCPDCTCGFRPSPLSAGVFARVVPAVSALRLFPQVYSLGLYLRFPHLLAFRRYARPGCTCAFRISSLSARTLVQIVHAVSASPRFPQVLLPGLYLRFLHLLAFRTHSCPDCTCGFRISSLSAGTLARVVPAFSASPHFPQVLLPGLYLRFPLFATLTLTFYSVPGIPLSNFILHTCIICAILVLSSIKYGKQVYSGESSVRKRRRCTAVITTAYLSGKRTEHRKVHVPILFGRNQSTTQPQ